MKTSELRKKSNSELDKLLKDSREKIRSLRFNLIGGKVKNVRDVRDVKRDVAKILTLLNETTEEEILESKQEKNK